MSFDWGQFSTNLGNLTAALTTAGVSSGAMPALLGQIGAFANPNKAEELALCSQLLQFASQPAIEQQLALKLLTEAGLPKDAAALVMTLMDPKTDIPTRVQEIKQIIQQGS